MQISIIHNKTTKSKDWIINPTLNCCKINVLKKHVCRLSSSSDIRVNKDLSISSVYMLKHFNKLFNVTQEENISVFNKNLIFFLLSIKLWALMWGECRLCQKLLNKGWPCDKSTGYKMANTLAGSFFMQGTMDTYSNTRKFKNIHVIKTQYVLLLIKIAYMEKKC